MLRCWFNIPNEIAIFHRDNDQQNHWVQWGTQHFQTHPYGSKNFETWNCFLAVLACILHELHVLNVSEDYEPYEANKQHGCIFSSMVRLSPFSVFLSQNLQAIKAGPQFIVCPQSGIESSHDMFSLLQERKQPDFPESFS